MAITVDQASIGTFTNDLSDTTAVLTTSAAVASGGFIVLAAGGFGTNTDVTGVSGGGLTWTVDVTGNTNSKSIGIASAQAPSGLASSTAITVTFGAAINARWIGATSYTGVKDSSPLDTTVAMSAINAATTWTTGLTAIQAGSVLYGTCSADANVTGHTATSGTEAWEADNSDDHYGGVGVYRIEASAGSYACAGTFAGSVAGLLCAAAYLAAADEPPAGDVTRARRVHSRMTSW